MILSFNLSLFYSSFFPSLQPSAFCAGQPTLHRPDANALAGSGRQSLVSEPKKKWRIPSTHGSSPDVDVDLYGRSHVFRILICLYGRKSRKYKPGSRSHTNYFYVDTETLWMCLKLLPKPFRVSCHVFKPRAHKFHRNSCLEEITFSQQSLGPCAFRISMLLMSPGLVLHHYTPRIARVFLESLYTPTTSNNWI